MSFTGSALDLHLKSVLLATDFSPVSLKPLHHALAIASHYGAKLYVAHVVSPAVYLMAGPEAFELGCEAAYKEAQQLEEDLVARGSLNDLDHEFIVRQGRVWEELQGLISQKEIDLVVVATHARRGIEKLILGSVAEQVFRDASCPVLTVGPHSYQEVHVNSNGATRTFLFATDLSEASLHALPHAVSLAHRANAKLIVLHVIPATPTPEALTCYSVSSVISMRENARMACLRQLEHSIPAGELVPLETEFIVRVGIPSEKILQLALDRGLDLIIMGVRRSPLVGAISHVPYGTAYEVACGAGCPVLTVRQ